MVSITFSVIVTLLLGIVLYYSFIQPNTQGNKIVRSSNTIIYFMILIAAAFIIRIIAAAKYPGHETDMNCFSAWASSLFENGISKFYSSDSFTDYPPGYMYILWIIGAMKTVVTDDSMVRVLVKMPAMLCDIATGYLLYNETKKRYSDIVSLNVAGFYLLNPAVIINSAFWGQVDAVFTLFLYLMILLMTNKRLIYSYIAFAIAVFIKPQAFMFTPIVAYAIIEQLFLDKEKRNSKIIIKHIMSFVGSFAVIFLLMIPFGVKNVIAQYIATLDSYQYFTVNAFNMWGAFGQNWKGLTAGGNVIGYIFLALIVAGSAVIFFKSKNESKYYFSAGFITFMTYMLSVKMHERYVFTGMIMFITAFVLMPTAKNFMCYLLLSVSQLLNTAYILFVYQKDINTYAFHPFVKVGSWINLVLMAAFLIYAYKSYVKNEDEIIVKSIEKKKITSNDAEKYVNRNIETSDVFPKLTKTDIIAMVVITVIYGGVALYNLGDMEAPQNEYMMKNEGDKVVLDLGEVKDIDKLQYFLGSYEHRKISVKISDTQSFNGKPETEISMDSVFSWAEQDFNEKGRYIEITAKTENTMIKEFALKDDNGKLIIPVNADEFPGLFDEQDYVPEKRDYLNSTYFDEIYHARTGYEFLHGLKVYEWTHPPLGKVIISLGIKIFGMTPFGWRISGTVIGILMIPVMYLMVKQMFKRSYIAIIATVLYTFDFMHFTQTRISTIDVYGTFFIMLMYYFMYKYYSMSFYDTPFKKTLVPLALSGISMGLAMASKWTGVYAAVGLAVLFFISYTKRYKEYVYAKITPKGETNGISHEYIVNNYKDFAVKTFWFCCIVFIAVPLIIYCMSYIPYMFTEGAEGFKTILKNQSDMLTYHGKTVLGSEHPYSSKWYEWLIMKRPIWYFSGTVSEDIKEGISAFGNPAVWWVGIPAYLYVCYMAVRNKSKTALFIMIGYLSQLVFWIPIERLTFIYHYFPSVPFLVYAIAFCIDDICKRYPKFKYAAFAYAGVAVVLFIMFYPVLSGYPVSVDYVKNYLKWFDSWVLI